MYLRIETRLGIIGACIPAIGPLLSSSKRIPFRGWSKIFARKSAPESPAGDERSWRKARLRSPYSISEALRTHEDDSRALRMHDLDPEAMTAVSSSDESAQHTTKLITGYALQELEGCKVKNSREREIFPEEHKMPDIV